MTLTKSFVLLVCLIAGFLIPMHFVAAQSNNLLMATKSAEEIEARKLLTKVCYNLYSLYERKGEYKTTYEYLKKYTSLNKSIENIESQSENELKSLKIRYQKYFIYAFSGLIILSLLFLFILFYFSRLNKKGKKLIETKTSLLSEQNALLEKELADVAESKDKYHALSLGSHDHMLIMQNKELIFMNDNLCRLLGYQSMKETQKLSAENILVPQNLQFIINDYDALINGVNSKNQYPITLVDKSGKTIEAILYIVIAHLNGIPSVVGTVKVVTDSEKYETQLLLEKEKAEQATLAKSMFLAGMSHEIRNHLNSIIGISEVLVESKLTPELNDYSNVIYNSGNALLTIINDILDLSKIEAGQVNLDLAEFKLSQALNDIESMFELSILQHNLYLNVTINPDIPAVLIGDMQRLSQVLINLTSNAIKFTDEGGIHIKIDLIEQHNGTIKLKFNVIDTGVGISPESQDKLFKAFSQTHAAVERKKKGTGLGLVICKNIVMLMNGEIGIDSSINKGSNFWFTANFQLPDKSLKSNTSEKNLQMDDKILLVEDNLLNQHLTTTILGKQGYKTDIADNGKIGVQMFQKKFYKIILMDIQMPEMDGIEATRLIREYEATNYSTKSTIIAVTAHAKEAEKELLFEAGMNHYLRKPFKPDELLALLEYVRNN